MGKNHVEGLLNISFCKDREIPLFVNKNGGTLPPIDSNFQGRKTE